MWHRITYLTPLLRVALIVVSALGLLGLGIVLVSGGMRGEAAAPKEDASDEPRVADIPPMDREAPENVETATFALG